MTWREVKFWATVYATGAAVGFTVSALGEVVGATGWTVYPTILAACTSVAGSFGRVQ